MSNLSYSKQKKLKNSTKLTLTIIGVLGVIFSFLFIANPALAHRSGCHRWHSCPSDSGSYTCGDLGYPCRYSSTPSNNTSYSTNTYTVYSSYKYGNSYYSTRPTVDLGFSRLWEGKTILDVYDSQWYLVKNNKKHVVPDSETAAIWGLLYEDANGFTNYNIQRIESGEQLKYWEAPRFINNKSFFEKWEGKTIIDVTNGKMYLVKNWQKHHVVDFYAMISWGLIYEDATGFSTENLHKIPDGDTLYYSTGHNYYYIEQIRDNQFADVNNYLNNRLYNYIQDNYYRIRK